MFKFLLSGLNYHSKTFCLEDFGGECLNFLFLKSLLLEYLCNDPATPAMYNIVWFHRPSFMDFYVGHPFQDYSKVSTLNCEILMSFDARPHDFKRPCIR